MMMMMMMINGSINNQWDALLHDLLESERLVLQGRLYNFKGIWQFWIRVLIIADHLSASTNVSIYASLISWGYFLFTFSSVHYL